MTELTPAPETPASAPAAAASAPVSGASAPEAAASAPAVTAAPVVTSAPPAPAGLTPEAVEQLRTRITALGEGACDNAVIGAAQRIAKLDQPGGALGVYTALPQIAHDVRQGAEARIDVNGSRTVERPELLAAMIAAAQIAHKSGVRLEEVKIEDIAQLTPEIYKKVTQEKTLSCRPSR